MIQTVIPSGNNINRAKVELYDGSTLISICTCADRLTGFDVERVGETGKVFGFGVIQRLNLELIDLDRNLFLSKGNTVKVGIGDGTNFDYPYPTFIISDVQRNETTNGISVVAYDILAQSSLHDITEVQVGSLYTLKSFLTACKDVLGINTLVTPTALAEAFNLLYAEGANFTGSETLRQIFNYAAEVSQSIYFMDNLDRLVFKQLDRDGDKVYTITKTGYFNLSTGTPQVLTGICHTTELADNIISGDETGLVQYIRDNPFLNMRSDVATILDNGLAKIGGLTICPFTCQNWSGNHCLEIGDKIEVTTEDDGAVVTYILDDVLSFDGVIAQSDEWEYKPSDTETEANPSSLGDKLNQTFARVDKVNKEITLLASEVTQDIDNISESVSQLKIDTSSISASVTEVDTKLDNTTQSINDSIETLTQAVSLKVDSEQVEITVEKKLEEGVDRVTTTTKQYTFDDSGLNISSSGSEISTVVSEDGMTISKNTQEVLVANNQGVKAEDLHATTFLIIGKNSRLEDFGSRTACYWIGE